MLLIFWAARSKYGDLTLSKDKPVRLEEEGLWGLADEENGVDYPVDRGLLPNLKWEDEPIRVRISGLKEV